MKRNKLLNEYLDSVYNKDENFTSICNKIDEKDKIQKRVISLFSVIVIILMAGLIPPTYAKLSWEIEFNKYKDRQISREKIALNELVSDGYREITNMDYIYKDEIGAKINSFIYTKDYIQLDVAIKQKDQNFEQLDNNMQFLISFAVYDENNNILGIYTGFDDKNSNYYKKLYRELDVKYNENDVYTVAFANSCGFKVDKIKENEIAGKITMKSDKGFPDSKKMYVRLFGIEYVIFNNNKLENVYLTENEWQFDVSIPERFLENENIELIADKQINGISIIKAEATETGLSIYLEIDGLDDLIKNIVDSNENNKGEIMENIAYISDEEDNIYLPLFIRSTEKNNEQKLNFGIGKKILNKSIFLNINLPEKKEKIKLIQFKN